jgi:Ribonuclease G/E
MAQYRWNVDLKDNRKQAVHFLTKRVGIEREFLEDVIEEVKQACSPIKHRQQGFSKKMSTERERRRAVELVQQIEDGQRRWSKAARRKKKGDFNRIIHEEINPRRKELARLMRQYNFTRPGTRSKLVSRLLYGFSKLNQTNAEGMELRVHAIHGFAIMLYCDGLLKVSEKTVRHATPAYQGVARRIERFASGKFPQKQKHRILGRIAYITNLRRSLLASPHVTEKTLR